METIKDGILVKNAREHNLKGVNLQIPRNRFTVITGLSGSGKSSLAFDTVYAEGQRRYMDSLSAYARQFLDQMKKPEVDVISGLSPAIAIDQKSVSISPRSTVGTVTEIYDYMRLLYARVGQARCPTHNVPVTSQSVEQILAEVLNKPAGQKFYVLAPMAQDKKGEFLKEFRKWFQMGYLKAKVDGQIIELENAKKLAKTRAHTIDLVVDQLVVKAGLEDRLKRSLTAALDLAYGNCAIETTDGKRTAYSIHSACPVCGFSFPALEPRFFSFNSPRGACQTCNGLGTADLIEEEVENYGRDGAKILETRYRLKDQKHASDEDDVEDEETLLDVCPDCRGNRLRPEVLSVFVKDKNIAELSLLSAKDLRQWIEKQTWTAREQAIAPKIVRQIVDRLTYLIDVGAPYLSLHRSTRTLSGGEAQRIRLASQLGSALVGILYVMDEPSIGLHPRDHHRLLDIIMRLRDRGNTVLVVEHDEDTIRAADYVYDFGPRAGSLGGEIMAHGTPAEIEANPSSLTGRYLAGKESIPIPSQRRQSKNALRLIGATGNNLKNVDVEIPLGCLSVVTGVSGSGKSTLVIDTLYRALAQEFYKTKIPPAPFRKLEGLEHLDKVIEIDQKPIGRTPRSTPATYVGLFPLIRDLYSQLPDSKIRGYAPGRFSFNVKGGRCESCMGHGQIRMAMHFLSDVFVTCDECLGARYNRETLQIKYKGKSISEVLNMTVAEAHEFFQFHNSIKRKLEILERVGLDYMTLGQSSTTLSGGEAQRVKLAKELSKRGTGRTFYILDEPTTGLHFEDTRKLMELLQSLADQGNTVLVIEHNLDVIKAADYVVDLGPEGGDQGGNIVFSGPPEGLARCRGSETAPFLKKVLERH